MESYLCVLKYVLQLQNFGKSLIRPVLLQGLQQLVLGAHVQDPPAWKQELSQCMCCLNLFYILYLYILYIFFNIASLLNTGLTGKHSLGLGCVCVVLGFFLFFHVFPHVSDTVAASHQTLFIAMA